ncbi:hypothetical protein D3C87_2022730 [compost metagenome]
MRLRQIKMHRDRFTGIEVTRVQHTRHPFLAGELDKNQRFIAKRLGDRNAQFALMNGVSR